MMISSTFPLPALLRPNSFACRDCLHDLYTSRSSASGADRAPSGIYCASQSCRRLPNGLKCHAPPVSASRYFLLPSVPTRPARRTARPCITDRSQGLPRYGRTAFVTGFWFFQRFAIILCSAPPVWPLSIHPAHIL